MPESSLFLIYKTSMKFYYKGLPVCVMGVTWDIHVNTKVNYKIIIISYVISRGN